MMLTLQYVKHIFEQIFFPELYFWLIRFFPLTKKNMISKQCFYLSDLVGPPPVGGRRRRGGVGGL